MKLSTAGLSLGYGLISKLKKFIINELVKKTTPFINKQKTQR